MGSQVTRKSSSGLTPHRNVLAYQFEQTIQIPHLHLNRGFWKRQTINLKRWVKWPSNPPTHTQAAGSWELAHYKAVSALQIMWPQQLPASTEGRIWWVLKGEGDSGMSQRCTSFQRKRKPKKERNTWSTFVCISSSLSWISIHPSHCVRGQIALPGVDCSRRVTSEQGCCCLYIPAIT